MGSRIEAVSAARSGTGLFRKGSVKLAVKAAVACLKKAGRSANELGLIVNTGVCRDDNVCEPAICAFIQEEIGANLGDFSDEGTSTFCFDLSNGGCGLLTGIQVVDGFVAAETIALGMVVTSDANPYPRNTEPFDFTAAGAAVLLSRGEKDDGFVAYRTVTFPEYGGMFENRVTWLERDGKKGKHILTVRHDEAYASRCVDCAGEVLDGFLDEHGLRVRDIDLLIPSQSPPGFPDGLKKRIGIRGSRMMDVTGEYGNVYTAGPAAALEAAVKRGRFEPAENILFLTVGAGITVSMALYRNPAS
jgi:3-oxoacyl-[acyl-carrier-protein] synthase-3